MKKLQISGKEFIRFDGLRYNLTDLFRLTTLAGIRQDPWAWAQSEGRTRDISRRGWFFKKCWAKQTVLIEYAKYLTPGLYDDVIKALDLDNPDRLIAILGERLASKLDWRAAERLTQLEQQRKEQREAVMAAIAKLPNSREVREDSARDWPDLQKVSRFDSSKLPKPKPRTPVRSMTQNRGATTSRSLSHHGDSVVHHRSEPDYLTQALILDTIMSSDPEPSRHSFSDVCSSHSSSYDSGSSWSGDSGGSDSGSSGGCD